MKNFTIFLIIVALNSTLFSQVGTFTSAGNGNWTSPTTWSPMGVPAPGSTVTINHNVILDNDYGYTSGSITVNAGGSLTKDIVGRNFMVNGGDLDVAGSMDVTNFSLMAGSASISGTLDVHLMYSISLVDNYGTINVDSLQNSGELNNYANATLNAFRFLNSSEFNNSGVYEGTDFYNDGNFINNLEVYLVNYSNAVWAYNYDYIEFDDFTNLGEFYNEGTLYGYFDFTNTGYFEHYGDFSLTNDFLNADTINGIGAYFYTESLVTVGNNWYNVDTIEGTATAQFCIINETGNEGEMIGSFDFCDNTPPVNPPYIDINIGNIDANIVYCNTACNTGIPNNNIVNQNVNVYPNPFTEKAQIILEGSEENVTLKIYNSTGQVVFTQKYFNEQIIEIYSKDLGKGLMLFNLSDGNKVFYSGKFIIE